MDWLRRLLLMPTKHIIEIEKAGNLYFLLNAAIGALNRYTDAILTISKAETELASLKQQLHSASDPLKKSVADNQPKEK